MKIAVTGHRPNKLGNEYNLQGIYSDYIRKELSIVLEQFKIASSGNITGITGMALGVDQIFAQVCISLKIPFIAAVPCFDQDSMWPARSIALYHSLLSQAKEKVYVTEGYYNKDCMQKRNEWMVDHCDVLIAVWDGTHGGTKNCFDYAVRTNKIISRINPKDARSTSQTVSRGI
jgi:uncharacterized phage-like protein YoqJ